jgi:hypothetical protein
LRDVLRINLPDYTEARIADSDLTQVQPAEYRADLVVLLHNDKPVLGIVLEVQLSVDPDKSFAWPAYAVSLRARERCPVCLLVFAVHEPVLRWAANPIDLGGGNTFTASVIGRSGVPVITDLARARAEPELAVLSAMAHGQSDASVAAQIGLAAIAASLDLEPERSVLYFDLVLTHLSEAARASLQTMDPATYEFQSEFAKRYLSQGRAEGRTEGRAEGEVAVLSKLLQLKFGPLDSASTERLRGASTTDIERWAERILSAATLEEVFG